MVRRLSPGVHMVRTKRGMRKVRVLKNGQWRFMKMGSTTPRTRRRSPFRRTRRRGVRRLARRYRRKRRRRKSRTIPILPLVGAGAGLAIPAATSGGGLSPINAVMEGNFGWAVEGVIENYSGYNIHTGNWDIKNARGLLPAVAGGIAHKILNMLGVNRTFANLPSPLNKLRL